MYTNQTKICTHFKRERLQYSVRFLCVVSRNGGILLLSKNIFSRRSFNGTLISQYCRWWATENPNFVKESNEQYTFKINVWCGIFNDRLVGPFFFQEYLKADRYFYFLERRITLVWNNLPFKQQRGLYFHQDGASIHSTAEVKGWLLRKLKGQSVDWPLLRKLQAGEIPGFSAFAFF